MNKIQNALLKKIAGVGKSAAVKEPKALQNLKK